MPSKASTLKDGKIFTVTSLRWKVPNDSFCTVTEQVRTTPLPVATKPAPVQLLIPARMAIRSETVVTEAPVHDKRDRQVVD